MIIGMTTHFTDLGLIEVSGADAAAFLQTQLSNEVLKQELDGAAWNAYCNPKGRMLASFLMFRDGDRIFLTVAADLAAVIAQRLGKFVLRAKAKVTDASDAWRLFVVMTSEDSASFDQPGNVLQVLWQQNIATIRLPDSLGMKRYLCVVPTERVETWLKAVGEPTSTSVNDWHLGQIHAGIAHIVSATTEKFIPQTVNYELIGGVSFKKGCYPGQEVVARSQYLGKLKRRMFLGTVESRDSAVQPGVDIMALGHDEPVGSVVNVAANFTGGMDLLFEISQDMSNLSLQVCGLSLSWVR